MKTPTAILPPEYSKDSLIELKPEESLVNFLSTVLNLRVT